MGRTLLSAAFDLDLQLSVLVLSYKFLVPGSQFFTLVALPHERGARSYIEPGAGIMNKL